MKFSSATIVVVISGSILGAASVRADQPAAAGADPDLPQSFDAAMLTSLVEKPPFNRIVSFEDTYLLTGVAYVEGKPLATLVNKETKQRYVVGQEPNAQGWHLAAASAGHDPRYTEVKLVIGDEEVALHYTDVLQAPGKKSSSSSSGSGRRREVTPVDIHKLSESEYLRKDENGKTYVRGSIYLPTEDRDRYYNSMSSPARDRFRQLVQDARDKMFSYTPDQRAAFAKKAFDQAEAEERAGKLR